MDQFIQDRRPPKDLYVISLASRFHLETGKRDSSQTTPINPLAVAAAATGSIAGSSSSLDQLGFNSYGAGCGGSGGQLQDMNIKGINMSISGRDLLVDAHLKLSAGTHYGFIGRNGVGKSLLLKAIAYGWIPGISPDLNIFYVDQLDRADQLNQKVIDLVLNADWRKAEAATEMEKIEAALAIHDAENEDHLRELIMQLKRGRMNRILFEAQKDVTKTSGARGSDARKRMLALEDAMEKLSLTQEEEQSPTVVLHRRLSELNELFQDREAQIIEARRILSYLGFTEDMQNGQLLHISGGWRIRVSLAMAVFVNPVLLLLDEPTNHLDLPAIAWLTNYLQGLTDVTLVIISHDRQFLNDTVDEIILLQGGQLTYHNGNYDAYIETQQEQRDHRQKMRSAIDKKKEKMRKSIEAGMAHAKKTMDDKKMAQMASKKKKLIERTGMERNEHGHRFKLNRDRVGYFTTNRGDVANEFVEASTRIVIAEPNDLSQPGPLVQVDNVAFWYPSEPSNSSVIERVSQMPAVVRNANGSISISSARKPSSPSTPSVKPVLSNVTINISQGTRLAFVGANGQGKTTLMGLLTGNLTPTRGSIKRHPQAKLGYFAQHFVDSLQEETTETPLSYLATRYPDRKEQELYAQLGAFGLTSIALVRSEHSGTGGVGLAHQPLSTLSGGQRVRFAFALMMMEKPHALFLDEPTNHLDLDATEALAESLQDYTGAVILVSHDVYFVKQVVGDENVYLVEDSQVKLLDGGVETFYASQLKKAAKGKSV